jgi:hypothetical protein
MTINTNDFKETPITSSQYAQLRLLVDAVEICVAANLEVREDVTTKILAQEHGADTILFRGFVLSIRTWRSDHRVLLTLKTLSSSLDHTDLVNQANDLADLAYSILIRAIAKDRADYPMENEDEDEDEDED